MCQEEATAEVVVQGCAVLPGARQPSPKGWLAMSEHARGGGQLQSFGERGQHLSKALGRCFQAIERGIAARAEGGATRLTAQGLDALALAMSAIPNQSVNLRVGNPVVGAGAVQAGEALSVNLFGGTTTAF